MQIQNVSPEEIEKKSFEIISRTLKETGNVPDRENAGVIMRCIHASADFDYARTLTFSKGAVCIMKELILSGADIVTDTNMAKAGINQKKLSQYGGTVRCFMAEEDVRKEAEARGMTRAAVSMERAAKIGRKVIFAVGNAPTALIRLHAMMQETGFRPDFVIGVPVGFVNVIPAKELFAASDVPHIINRGPKGGSSIAAAICNAVLYEMSS